jgi:ribonuclease G
LVGNIYIGKVQSILPGTGGAFITLEKGLTAYLALEDMEQIIFTKKISDKAALCQGDELVVQISKDAIKTKNAICTTNISFAAQDVILTTGQSGCGVSRKIPKARRAKIKEAFAATEPYGLVFRTSAGEETIAQLQVQVHQLQQEYETFCSRVPYLNCFTLLKEGKRGAISFLQQLPRRQWSEISEIICDNVAVQQDLMQYQDVIPVRLYTDPDYSLWQLYGLSAKLEQACQPTVWLDSGAFLVIEPTEALTVIDVNSGKNIGAKSASDRMFRINQEACDEIARQLRLRNISGIILVDFINLKDASQQQELLRYLRQVTADDGVGVQVLDYTKLGLVEMTRKKVYASLAQQLGQL